jgi:pimeloyl-ACP methyl ester carboxylesterase
MAAAARLGQRIQALQAQGVLPDPLPPRAEFRVFFSDPAFPVEHPDENAVRTTFSPTANQLTWAATRGFDLTADVSRLRHRVLIVFGEDDPAGMELIEETLDALQSAEVEFVLLEQCGHFWHERPDQFYPPVRAFLGLAVSKGRANHQRAQENPR